MEKTFTVKLELAAQSEKQIENWLDRVSFAEKIYDAEIIDPDKKRFQERIRYDENWNDEGEHFVFEGKWTDEDEWSLDSAFKLFDYKNGDYFEKGSLINYQALTKIRELMKCGTEFWFSKKKALF